MISTSLQTSHQPLPCKGGMGPGLISILFSVSCWQISPSRASAEQGRCRRKGTARQWDYPPDAECPQVPVRLCSAQTWPGAPLLLPQPGISPPFLAQPARHSSRTPRPFPGLAPIPIPYRLSRAGAGAEDGVLPNDAVGLGRRQPGHHHAAGRRWDRLDASRGTWN